jgi:hypothetical protein
VKAGTFHNPVDIFLVNYYIPNGQFSKVKLPFLKHVQVSDKKRLAIPRQSLID